MSRVPVILLSLLLLHAAGLSPCAMAAGPDDPAGEDDGGSVDIYLAIGAAAIVGGLLLLDILHDGAADSDEPALVPTGVDWNAVEQEMTREVAVAVSGPVQAGVPVRDALTAAGAPEGMTVYPDVLDLGDSPGMEKFSMASSFFGTDLLVVVPGDPVAGALEVYGREGLLWSGSLDDVAEAVWYIARSSGED